MILQLQDCSKRFGARTILSNTSLTVGLGEKLGLVGENGSGKTTIARIALGEEEVDQGRVICQTTVGYLPQEPKIESEVTTRAFLQSCLSELDEVGWEMRALEKSLSKENLERYGDLQERFEVLGGYDIDHRIEQVLTGLGLSYLRDKRDVNLFSSGEKTRLYLAGLLLQSPGLLILDEPTNHLDFQALDWLEGYLTTFSGALLLISHDRHLLNQIVTRIVALESGSLESYPGNFDAYYAEQQRRFAQRQAEFDDYCTEVKQLRMAIKAKTFSRKGSGRPTDSNVMAYNRSGERHDEKVVRRQIRQAEKRLEELTENPVDRPYNPEEALFRFQPEPLPSQRVVDVNGLHKSFGEEILLANLSLSVASQERVVISGANGAGKSTLLKILAGTYSPDRGEVAISDRARIGVITQDQEELISDQTVLDYYSNGLVGSEADFREDLHKYGLFRGQEVFQLVGSLSCGQRQKLQLTRVIASRANLLLLDEPTNHLDLLTLSALEKALINFSGTVIAISHDRLFLNRIATRHLILQGGQLQLPI